MERYMCDLNTSPLALISYFLVLFAKFNLETDINCKLAHEDLINGRTGLHSIRDQKAGLIGSNSASQCVARCSPLQVSHAAVSETHKRGTKAKTKGTRRREPL